MRIQNIKHKTDFINTGLFQFMSNQAEELVLGHPVVKTCLIILKGS